MRKPKGGVSRKLIEKCISEFGFEVLKTKDCEFSNLSYLLKGCEAVIILEWKDHDFTHAVFGMGVIFWTLVFQTRKLIFILTINISMG
jgi:hypothetical protein